MAQSSGASSKRQPPSQPGERTRSCETACSSNSSCYLQKRKPVNPLANPYRTGVPRSTGNAVRQRVLSAKLLKLRTLQSQLNDANFHLAELMRENQALKTLQKRQDRALTKYEGTKADLPKILQSYESEVHALTERNKNFKKTIKELSDQLKSKNDEILTLQSKLKRFENLDKDKHLLEREKLLELVDDYKIKLQKADEEIVLLNRKLCLETKSNKQKLNIEISKYKQCHKNLVQALDEVAKLNKCLENKSLTATSNSGSRTKLTRSIQSMVALNGMKSSDTETNLDMKAPVTDVKLEPILCKKNDKINKDISSILKSPSDNIKARLAAVKLVDEDSPKAVSPREDKRKLPRPNSSIKLDKLVVKEPIQNQVEFEDNIKEILPNYNDSNKDDDDDEDFTFDRLEQLTKTCEEQMKKEQEENGSGLDQRLGDYCLRALDSIKTCNNTITSHRERFDHSQNETEKLIDSVKRVDDLDRKLKSSQIFSFSTENVTDDNLDMVSHILSEELKFQNNFGSKDKNGNIDRKEPLVSFDEKKKLLATLRAIDNGDSIESIDIKPQQHNSKLLNLLDGIDDD